MYTPIDKVFALSYDTILDQATRREVQKKKKNFLTCGFKIYQRGHSRIPIYLKKRENFIGIALAKTLLGLEDGRILFFPLETDPVSGTPFAAIELVPTPQVSTDIPLFTLLNQFMAGKSTSPFSWLWLLTCLFLGHMAVVLSKEDNSTIVGVVTLEDIIEELLQSEIYDEKVVSFFLILSDLAGYCRSCSSRSSGSLNF